MSSLARYLIALVRCAVLIPWSSMVSNVKFIWHGIGSVDRRPAGTTFGRLLIALLPDDDGGIVR